MVLVCHALRKIIKQVSTEVSFIELDRNTASEILGPNTIRRTRFFYIDGIKLPDVFLRFLE